MGTRWLVVGVIAFIAQWNLGLSLTEFTPRIVMSQQQACYYQPHNKELVCQCREGENKSYMHLRLREFVIQGQEVR